MAMETPPLIPSGKRLYITNWNITMLLMGKSTISMAIFHSFLYVYQRVDVFPIHTPLGDRRVPLNISRYLQLMTNN